MRRILSALPVLLACVVAPGVVEAQKPGPAFTDVTADSGIEHLNVCGPQPEEKGWINEYMGAGAAWLDYDGDGHLDLYLVNGSTHERASGRGEPNQLYRGDGKGGFRDVTAASGTGDRGWGYGVVVGDIDNDGDPDLYVTNLGPNVLYRNNGDGTFEDITSRAGVGHDRWSTSAAFFDMEGDGDLDLFVGNYVDFDKQEVPRRGSKRAQPPYCEFKGIPVFCGPRGLPPAPNVLYRNDGDGKFTEVTRDAGIFLKRPRYTLGVVTVDYDNDGDVDIYTGNDSVLNSLWRNKGDGTFEEAGMLTLSALDGAGNPQGCMGVGTGDYDGDGWMDIVVTNFSHDLNTVYRNVSGKFFMDESAAVGMPATAMELSWGTGFYDFDQDGDLDLFIANGHVYPEVDTEDIGSPYRQKNHIFTNDAGNFREVSALSSKAFAQARSYRGTAFADYDEDGDIDILVTALDAPVQLLENVTPKSGHYLKIQLVGSRSNRDAIGARVSLTAGGRKQIRERKSGGSYLSDSDPRIHFGLGAATKVERIEIRWPSGVRQTLRDVAVDQTLTIREKAE